LVLPEMQLLFRVARLVSCRHQVDEKFHDKARWFSPAAGRIGQLKRSGSTKRHPVTTVIRATTRRSRFLALCVVACFLTAANRLPWPALDALHRQHQTHCNLSRDTAFEDDAAPLCVRHSCLFLLPGRHAMPHSENTLLGVVLKIFLSDQVRKAGGPRSIGPKAAIRLWMTSDDIFNGSCYPVSDDIEQLLDAYRAAGLTQVAADTKA
jgi:hypothetical protein